MSYQKPGLVSPAIINHCFNEFLFARAVQKTFVSQSDPLDPTDHVITIRDAVALHQVLERGGYLEAGNGAFIEAFNHLCNASKLKSPVSEEFYKSAVEEFNHAVIDDGMLPISPYDRGFFGRAAFHNGMKMDYYLDLYSFLKIENYMDLYQNPVLRRINEDEPNHYIFVKDMDAADLRTSMMIDHRDYPSMEKFFSKKNLLSQSDAARYINARVSGAQPIHGQYLMKFDDSVNTKSSYRLGRDWKPGSGNQDYEAAVRIGLYRLAPYLSSEDYGKLAEICNQTLGFSQIQEAYLHSGLPQASKENKAGLYRYVNFVYDQMYQEILEAADLMHEMVDEPTSWTLTEGHGKNGILSANISSHNDIRMTVFSGNEILQPGFIKQDEQNPGGLLLDKKTSFGYVKNADYDSFFCSIKDPGSKRHESDTGYKGPQMAHFLYAVASGDLNGRHKAADRINRMSPAKKQQYFFDANFTLNLDFSDDQAKTWRSSPVPGVKGKGSDKPTTVLEIAPGVHVTRTSAHNRVESEFDLNGGMNALKLYMENTRKVFEEAVNVGSLIETAESNDVPEEVTDIYEVNKDIAGAAELQVEYLEFLLGKKDYLSNAEHLKDGIWTLEQKKGIVDTHFKEWLNQNIGYTGEDSLGNKTLFINLKNTIAYSTLLPDNPQTSKEKIGRLLYRTNYRHEGGSITLIGEPTEIAEFERYVVDFDAGSAMDIDDHPDPYIRRMADQIRRSCRTYGKQLPKNLQIDAHGIVHFDLALSKTKKDGEPAYVSATLGPVYPYVGYDEKHPYENGVYIQTNQPFGQNRIYCFGNEMFILNDSKAKRQSAQSRLRVESFVRKMEKSISREVSDIIHDLSKVVYEPKEVYELGEPTSLLRVYKSSDSEMFSIEQLEAIRQSGAMFDENVSLYEYHLELMRMYSSRCRIDSEFANKSNVVDVQEHLRTAWKNHGEYADPIYLSDGLMISQGTIFQDLLDDTITTDSGKMNQNRAMGEYTHLHSDGTLTTDRPGEKARSEFWKYAPKETILNPMTRKIMCSKVMGQILAVANDTNIAFMYLGQKNQNDGMVISKSFADRMKIAAENKEGDVEIRSLLVGDKISDFHGNKGVISDIIDTSEYIGKTPEEMRKLARRNGDNPDLIMTFALNPQLDVVASPCASISRSNAGTFMEIKNRGELMDMVHPDGTVTKSAIGKIRQLILDKTVEEKVAIYEGPGQGRKFSQMLSQVLLSKNAVHIVDEFMQTMDSERNLQSARHVLSAFGLGISKTGELMDQLDQTSLFNEDGSVNTENVLDPSDKKIPAVILQQAFLDLDQPDRKLKKSAAYLSKKISPNARNMRRLTEKEMWNKGSWMELPFPLYISTQQATPFGQKPNGAETWYLPVLPVTLRRPNIGADGAQISTKFEPYYTAIAQQAVTYRTLNLFGAMRQAFLDPGQGRINDAYIAEVACIDISRVSVLRQYWSQYQQDKQNNLKAKFPIQLSKHEQKLIDLFDHYDERTLDIEKAFCEREAQKQLSKLQQLIQERMLTGKHNIFHEKVMSVQIPNSATVVAAEMPELDLDEVEISQELAEKLKVKDGNHVMIWRDPTHDSYSVCGMRVTVSKDPNMKAIRINPNTMYRMDGDFDGDQLAVVALKSKEARKELIEMFSPAHTMIHQGNVLEIEGEPIKRFRTDNLVKETGDQEYWFGYLSEPKPRVIRHLNADKPVQNLDAFKNLELKVNQALWSLDDLKEAYQLKAIEREEYLAQKQQLENDLYSCAYEITKYTRDGEKIVSRELHPLNFDDSMDVACGYFMKPELHQKRVELTLKANELEWQKDDLRLMKGQKLISDSEYAARAAELSRQEYALFRRVNAHYHKLSDLATNPSLRFEHELEDGTKEQTICHGVIPMDKSELTFQTIENIIVRTGAKGDTDKLQYLMRRSLYMAEILPDKSGIDWDKSYSLLEEPHRLKQDFDGVDREAMSDVQKERKALYDALVNAGLNPDGDVEKFNEELFDQKGVTALNQYFYTVNSQEMSALSQKTQAAGLLGKGEISSYERMQTLVWIASSITAASKTAMHTAHFNKLQAQKNLQSKKDADKADAALAGFRYGYVPLMDGQLIAKKINGKVTNDWTNPKADFHIVRKVEFNKKANLFMLQANPIKGELFAPYLEKLMESGGIATSAEGRALFAEVMKDPQTSEILTKKQQVEAKFVLNRLASNDIAGENKLALIRELIEDNRTQLYEGTGKHMRPKSVIKAQEEKRTAQLQIQMEAEKQAAMSNEKNQNAELRSQAPIKNPVSVEAEESSEFEM